MTMITGSITAKEMAKGMADELLRIFRPCAGSLPLRPHSPYLREQGRKMLVREYQKDEPDPGMLEVYGLEQRGLGYFDPINKPEIQREVINLLLAIRRLRNDARRLKVMSRAAEESQSQVFLACFADYSASKEEGREIVREALSQAN